MSVGWSLRAPHFLILAFSLCLSQTVASALAQVRRANRFDPKMHQRYFDVQAANPAEFSSGLTTTNARITLKLIIGQQTPEVIAVFVGRGEDLDPDNTPARWIPFTETLPVDLGEGDGERHIFVAARWKATDRNYEGSGFEVTVSRSRAAVWITRPKQLVTSQPVIQLQGRATRKLVRCSYDQFDQKGNVVQQDEDAGAGVNYPGGDPDADFTCIDVELTPGTNTFVLRCTDESGLTTTTNVTVVFSTAGDTRPPVFQFVHFPQPGQTVSGERFTARGSLDAYAPSLTGQLIGGGRTNQISGYAERNGYFWYKDLPLATGPNYLTLTATDAAGNSSHTNLMLVGVSAPVVTLDEIVPAQKLWQSRITVTGKLTPPTHRLLVNGVAAVVKADGTWVARDVPTVSPDGGGAATFDMTVLPLEEASTNSPPPKEQVLAQARLGTKPLTLNPARPACGVFQLHVADTAGRPFVLLTSTNLQDWTPILTNLNPGATFDYTDANVAVTGCRFFQIKPMQ
ncbi:MAG TPA: hypothetical protein VFZ59_08100 [Verrucomicrobiae bacterium]|nr:hypothetical protein [Verrucomicrobiae bacterium]